MFHLETVSAQQYNQDCFATVRPYAEECNRSRKLSDILSGATRNDPTLCGGFPRNHSFIVSLSRVCLNIHAIRRSLFQDVTFQALEGFVSGDGRI